MRRTLVLACCLAACSGPSAGSSPEREAEILALCDDFESARCPIGSGPFGASCDDAWRVRDIRSERTGCSAEHQAHFECDRASVCDAWRLCEVETDAAWECDRENPGGDTCTLACEASLTTSCAFTVDNCPNWCLRQETVRVVAGCQVEGEALDDCLAVASDVCAAETCAAQRATLAECMGGD
ncbi:MAG: hypothetical protein RLP09_00580 [Sandaracinaceae bacterium]